MTRHLRATITAVVLVATLVGGTVGIEAVAAHLSGELAHSDRPAPGPTAPADKDRSTPDAT